jgi:hypothetical protein
MLQLLSFDSHSSRRRYASCADFSLSIACSAAFAVSRLYCARYARCAGRAECRFSRASSRLRSQPENVARQCQREQCDRPHLYSFTGSACEGYTTEFRQVSQLDAGETKSRSVTCARPVGNSDGKTYRFKIDTRMNDADATSVDGIAERDGKTVKVKLKKPKAKTFTIEGAVFPTEQVRLIIEAAREGKSLLELVVYDGSDDGEKVYNTLTVIGQPIPGTKAPVKPDPTTNNEKFKSQTRWPVTVSYYDRATKSNAGEQTPVYAMSFELYEDGVSRACRWITTTSLSPARWARSTSRNQPCK